MNSLQKLPRNLDESGVVGVDFKRMKNMKNVHVKGFLRPTKMYQALVTLKVLGNPHYQTIIKKCLYCPREFQDDDKDMLEHVQKCLLKAQLETDDASNEGCQEIQKEELQLSLKPKIMESLERVKSIFLNEIKPFSKYQDITELNENHKVKLGLVANPVIEAIARLEFE